MNEEPLNASDEIERVDAIVDTDTSKSAPEDRAAQGPFDLAEVPSIRPYVDFGGIKVAPREGLKLRLEVEDRTKRVVAVTLDYGGSVLQLQAFSAPKTTGLWHGVRAEIAKQLTAQGARLEDAAGALGPELIAYSPVPDDQGGGERAVRFLAVDGPRWMLRGVIMGKATIDDEAYAQVIGLFRDAVVVRGEQPMPPSELLQLKIPAGIAGQASTDSATT